MGGECSGTGIGHGGQASDMFGLKQGETDSKSLLFLESDTRLKISMDVLTAVLSSFVSRRARPMQSGPEPVNVPARSQTLLFSSTNFERRSIDSWPQRCQRAANEGNFIT
jgi:hypothetical protein